MEARLLTLNEVAKLLRVDKMTVYRMVKRGAIPATRVGHQWRFEQSLIRQWLHKSNNVVQRKKSKKVEKKSTPERPTIHKTKKKRQLKRDRRAEQRRAAERRAARERRQKERRMEERRRFVRLTRGLPIELSLENPRTKVKQTLKALTRDISEAGLSFQAAKDNLPKNIISRRKLILAIDIPQQKAQLKLSAEVVWQQALTEKENCLGIRFVRLERQAQETLSSYIHQAWQGENQPKLTGIRTREEIKDIVAKVARRDLSEFDESTNIREELGIDSLQAMEILAAIETHLQITIDEIKAFNIVTVGDLFGLIEQTLSQKEEVKTAL